MPSKSKAQARFFAAAAHDPDFAKKAGLSTKTAKEWNQADKKVGTLKKGSKKPEHVKEEVLDEELLDEGSGVGNFPVPPSAMEKIRKYASSVLLTYAYKSFKKIVDRNEDSVDEMTIQKVMPYLKRFQKKYGAVVLDDVSFKRHVNQSIRLNLDPNAMFNEMPKSLQTEKVMAILKNMRIFFTLDASYGHNGAGGHAKAINDNTSEIVLSLNPESYNFSAGSGTDGLESTMQSMQYFMSGIDHEVQHAFQHIVTTKVSSAKDKNKERKDGYTGMQDAYHASGVEFGPQTQDLVNAANEWLELKNDEGKLTGKMNKDVSDAIKAAMERFKGTQGNLYNALKNYKEDANAKKHLTLIYKGVAKTYNNIVSSEGHELDLEPQSIDGGEDRMYHSNNMGPDKTADKNDPMIKLYHGFANNDVKPYNMEEDRESGAITSNEDNPYNKLSSITYKTNGVGIFRFRKKNSTTITLDAWEDGHNPANSEHISLDIPQDKIDVILKYISWFGNFNSIKRLTSEIESEIDGSIMDIEQIADSFGDWYNSAVSKNGGEPEGKQLTDEMDEGTLYFRLKGLRIPLYIQAGYRDGIVIDNAESYDTIAIIKYKNVEAVLTRLFEIYLECNDRQINRIFKNLGSKDLTVDELENTWEYVKETSNTPVEESSMRGFMDLVQDAEIADGIDQANKMTDVNLMNKAKKNKQHSINQLGEEDEFDLQGKPVTPSEKSAPVYAGTSTERDVKLNEMPQRFDSFQGQDPDVFVDKTTEMTGKSNLLPFSEHPDFTVMRNKSYTGFIAFDKNGKQIAVVSGSLSEDSVRGVKNVFEVSATASKASVKGVMYKIFMDIVSAGISILSDTLHSDSAIKFWTRLINSHEVYIVGGGEVLAKATPEKVHKYWSDDENSPSAELQLLLTK